MAHSSVCTASMPTTPTNTWTVGPPMNHACPDADPDFQGDLTAIKTYL